ncbi:unnamed protein product, partial [Heterosigma akashiwo]
KVELTAYDVDLRYAQVKRPVYVHARHWGKGLLFTQFRKAADEEQRALRVRERGHWRRRCCGG